MMPFELLIAVLSLDSAPVVCTVLPYSWLLIGEIFFFYLFVIDKYVLRPLGKLLPPSNFFSTHFQLMLLCAF
jgi:hypothetical protein